MSFLTFWQRLEFSPRGYPGDVINSGPGYILDFAFIVESINFQDSK